MLINLSNEQMPMMTRNSEFTIMYSFSIGIRIVFTPNVENLSATRHFWSALGSTGT